MNYLWIQRCFFVVILFICPMSTMGYIYDVTTDFTTDNNILEVTEGAMFATHKGPFGSGQSIVKVQGTVETKQTSLSSHIYVAFYDDSTWDQLQKVTKNGYCCTSGDCNGQATFNFPATDPTSLPILKEFSLHESETKPFTASTQVYNAGNQYALVFTCFNQSEIQDATAQMTFTFRNPYGYVPGQRYAFLPFYGAMFVVYLVFLLIYGTIMLSRRKFLLPLQYCVASVAGLGLVEYAAYFFMYLNKNSSGKPPCCPVTSDAGFAVVMHVLKTSVSGILLMALCAGFGVVRPKLTRRQTFAILGLGGALAISSSFADIDALSTYGPKRTVWAFLQLLLQVCLVVLIVVSLQETMAGLRRNGQSAKFDMYKSLRKALQLFVLAWIILTICFTMVNIGWIPIRWRLTWLFVAVYDLLYFVGMIVVAVIWAPGRSSYAYAWYSQGITSEEEIDYESDAELGQATRVASTPSETLHHGEIQLTTLQGEAARNAFTVGEPSDDEDEEDENIVSSRKNGTNINTNSHTEQSKSYAAAVVTGSSASSARKIQNGSNVDKSMTTDNNDTQRLVHDSDSDEEEIVVDLSAIRGPSDSVDAADEHFSFEDAVDPAKKKD